MANYPKATIDALNKDIKEHFTHLYPITSDMEKSFDSVSRLVMLDRYTQKDLTLKTLKEGDLVLTIVRDDPKFPARGVGIIESIDDDTLTIKVEPDYLASTEEHPLKMRMKKVESNVYANKSINL